MIVNVCQDIFWTSKYFVTKLGMVMQHHEPKCHLKKKLFAILKVKATGRAHIINFFSFYNIFWTVDWLVTKLGLMIHHHKPECPVKKTQTELLHSRSRSQWRVRMSVLVQMISSKPPNILLPNFVLWCIIMSQSVMQNDWLVFSRSQQAFIRSKFDSLYYTFWTAEPFATKLLTCWYSVVSQSVLWRNWVVVFRVKGVAKFQNVSEYLFGW